jgi:signal transduction histidine kinase
LNHNLIIINVPNSLAMRSLSGRQAAYAWYLVCVLLLLERCLYVCVPYRPGGAQVWIVLGNIGIGILPLAMYRFMSTYWGFRVRGLDIALMLPIAAALLSAVRSAIDPAPPQPSWDYVAYLGLTVAVSVAMVASVARRFRGVHWLERGVAIWCAAVALFGYVLEIVNLWLPLSGRWTWAGPPCHTLLAMGLGYLLLRRMALGADLHSNAARVLAQDFETGHDAADDTPEAWSDVSTTLLAQERRRLLRDIHDGFGSRLVMVLNRARKELPDADLQRQVHRALLDMRVMVDAMDPGSCSVAYALARFRARIEPVLEQAGLCSVWHIEGVEDLRIDDRRRLVGVLRCLEEFVDNVMRHADATTLEVAVRGSRARLQFTCSDDGRGLRPQDLGHGRGLLRASRRAELLGGDLRVGRRPSGGAICTLVVPLA